ncbi:MAG TPA: 4Fe-4S dicluster domain-containing protein [Desulfurococcales archaeon]|nr:4Fe-4S dicluster domain-containing protein [Desulfurococcales archaeon]
MKLRVLLLDIGGCEGCSIAVLRSLPTLQPNIDLHSQYLGNLDLNTKYDIAFIAGSICINDKEAIAKLKRVREISEIVIAFGSCASVGGITRFCRGGQEPRPEHRVFQTINSVIEVDYAIPGCPPAPQTVNAIVTSLIKGIGPFLKVFAALAKVKKLSGFDLLDDVVLTGLCVGCGACILSCPTDALQMIDRRPDLIVEKCIRCGTCYVRCPRATQILLTRYPSKVKVLARGV